MGPGNCPGKAATYHRFSNNDLVQNLAYKLNQKFLSKFAWQYGLHHSSSENLKGKRDWVRQLSAINNLNIKYLSIEFVILFENWT
jgi:hypothetical protein